MKNTVTITLDDKKVQALKMYLSEKNSSLDEQLSDYAEQHYGKVKCLRKRLCCAAFVPRWGFLYTTSCRTECVRFHRDDG